MKLFLRQKEIRVSIDCFEINPSNPSSKLEIRYICTKCSHEQNFMFGSLSTFLFLNINECTCPFPVLKCIQGEMVSAKLLLPFFTQNLFKRQEAIPRLPSKNTAKNTGTSYRSNCKETFHMTYANSKYSDQTANRRRIFFI